MNEKAKTETTTTKTENENGIITVKILGFNRTPSGLRLNTSPSLDIWVNSKAEYLAYKEKHMQEAEFTPRMIRTRAGVVKKVYDLNITEVSDEDLDTIFDRSFDETEANLEEKPY